MRLCVFAPREFINGKKDLKAQVADRADDALVAQRERVEGAGEKRHLVPLGHSEGGGIRAAGVDEAADLGEGRRAVVAALGGRRVFGQQKQQLFAAEAEQNLFIGQGQLMRCKQAAEGQKALVAHQRAVVGKAGQQKA